MYILLHNYSQIFIKKISIHKFSLKKIIPKSVSDIKYDLFH